MSEEKKQGLPAQPSPPFLNRGLFSDHFLKARLPQWKEWQSEGELASFRKQLLSLYESTKAILPLLNEPQTEKEFVQPVLDLLGYANSYIVQAPTQVGEHTNRPDYALFPDKTTKNKAYEKLKNNDYTLCIGVADAKYWERELDLATSSSRDTFTNQNPSFQIASYLTGTRQTWGILTNGRLWRLYCAKSHLPLGNYYQVDLVQLLEEAPEENLKYLYLFFRKAALIQVDGKSFLDRVLEDSNQYAVELEADIKERAYDVVEVLCRGFAAGFSHDELTEQTLKTIYDNSLTLLYRLLFVFYAEARELLPLTTNQSYHEKYSIHKLTQEIDETLAKSYQLSSKSTIYYQRISSLSKLINEGDPDLGVPEYNGGLFDPGEHPFLEQHAIVDAFLVQAIHQLARIPDKKLGREVAVDYNTLSERHLGSIYEGLLEFKPRIAPSDLVTIKDKGSIKYAPADKYPDKKIAYKKDELYLANDKGERKATGSYYTPEYIVNYIVENTLDPLTKEAHEKVKTLKPEVDKAITKWEKLKEQKQDLEPTDKYDHKIAEERERLLAPYLSLKVLDPAMGSGHFLARAMDFLAEAIATDPYIKPPLRIGEDSELTYYRRRVVESCIYGVDLNPLAVELAKLTLWLGTMAKSKPLSFLNHHLRVGNSIIGARVANLDEIPKVKGKKGKSVDLSRAPVQLGLFQEAFNKKLYDLLQNRALIAQLPTETLEDVRKKEKWEQDFEHNMQRFRTLADLWVSTYFGNSVAWDEYNTLIEHLQSPDPEWAKLLQKKSLQRAITKGAEKRFFHWELEFPEVFYDEKGNRKPNPGFDAVIGNPPYGSKGILDEQEKYFCDNTLQFTESNDVAAMFIEKSFYLLQEQGCFGFIIPKPLSYITSWSDIRDFLRSKIIQVIGDVSRAFPEVLLEQIIIICRNIAPTAQAKVVITGVSNNLLVRLGNVEQSEFSARIFPLYRYGVDCLIAQKMESVSKPLGDLTHIWSGIGGITAKLSKKPIGPMILKGDSISRYMLTDAVWYLSKNVISETDIKEHSINRIIAQDIVAHVTQPIDHIVIMATKIPAGTLTQETIINFSQTVKTKPYSLDFFLSIINCTLNSWYTYRFIFNKAIRTMHYRPGYADYSPIRIINFTTPEKQRKQLLEKGKKLYQEYLDNQNWDKLLAFVAERLPAKEDGTPDIEHEQSDVVHDLLAFLVEEMPQLHKEKQSKIKGFLAWLEKEILKGSVEDQKNKTRIKDFHNNTFEELLDVLKKNKVVKDPCPANVRDTIASEFSSAVNALTPLKARIKATDDLIDQIVYRLYELTDAEIAIMEGQQSH